MKCFLCNGKAKKKHFCFGCRVLICNECEDYAITQLLEPGHNPQDHVTCQSCQVVKDFKDPPTWFINTEIDYERFEQN